MAVVEFVRLVMAEPARRSYIENLESELKSAMVLTGCNTIKEIDGKILFR